MRYLFWDIDGTLLLTRGAGAVAMRSAIKEYYSLDHDFVFRRSLAGRTDLEILNEAVLAIKGRPDAADTAALIALYEKELAAALTRYEGSLLPNVEKTLRYFSDPASCYTNCLLTGNVKHGAYLKLARYEIENYFDFDCSAFGDLSENRCDLSRAALEKLSARNGKITSGDLIFIGDTPNDAACAGAIGSKCLIVLAGSSYKRDDFTETPWKIIDELPSNPEDLEKIFDEA